MDTQAEGFVQLGEDRGQTHYKFATDIVWAALLRGVTNKEREPKVNELLSKSARLNDALRAMDDAINCYANHRRLR